MDQTNDHSENTDPRGEQLDSRQAIEPKPQQPELPPGATKADLARWLKELEAQELAAKRKAEAKALRERQAKARQQVRPARSRVVELLYAYYLVPPIEGDRSETKRSEVLLGRLGLPDEAISKPEFDLVEAIKLDMHMATANEPDTVVDE